MPEATVMKTTGETPDGQVVFVEFTSLDLIGLKRLRLNRHKVNDGNVWSLNLYAPTPSDEHRRLAFFRNIEDGEQAVLAILETFAAFKDEAAVVDLDLVNIRQRMGSGVRPGGIIWTIDGKKKGGTA